MSAFTRAQDVNINNNKQQMASSASDLFDGIWRNCVKFKSLIVLHIIEIAKKHKIGKKTLISSFIETSTGMATLIWTDNIDELPSFSYVFISFSRNCYMK